MVIRQRFQINQEPDHTWQRRWRGGHIPNIGSQSGFREPAATCVAVKTSGIPSREGCTRPRFVEFFKVPRCSATFCFRPLISPNHCSYLAERSREPWQGAPSCGGCRLLSADRDNCLLWLGYVLRKPAFRLPSGARFARAGQGRKRRLRGSSMTWLGCMNKLLSAFASIGVCVFLVAVQEMRNFAGWGRWEVRHKTKVSRANAVWPVSWTRPPKNSKMCTVKTCKTFGFLWFNILPFVCPASSVPFTCYRGGTMLVFKHIYVCISSRYCPS